MLVDEKAEGEEKRKLKQRWRRRKSWVRIGAGVEQGSSSVDNFHGLKPTHLPLMFQKRKGK